jgi:alcohol-forming fatty acyl-CoA reductase
MHFRATFYLGFMGKVLIDKLLRTCPGIENIYLLIRKKKGKDIHTRIDELFDDPVMMMSIS